MSSQTSEKEKAVVYTHASGSFDSASEVRGSGFLHTRGTSNDSLEFKAATTSPANLLSAQSPISRHAQILQALKTNAIPNAAHVLDVEIAHIQSSAWIFTDEGAGFKNWLTNDEPLFWIKGVPGSGKSVLLRVICSDDRTESALDSPKRKSVRGHFPLINDSDLRESFVSLLHGILYHILKKLPELIGLIEPAFVTLLPLKDESREPLPLATLQAALYYLLQQEEHWISINIFIDGLDSLTGRHVEVVKFLKQIQRRKNNANAHTRVKICFTSRPERNYLETFASTLGLCIEDHTSQAVESVVKTLLSKDPHASSTLASGDEKDKTKISLLSSAICRRSKGAFIWARLAAAEVLQELGNGKTMDELTTVVEGLPADLDALYMYRVLHRIPARYRGEALIMFDIARCALRPLSVGQFHACFMNAQISDLHQYIEPTTSGADTLALVKDLIHTRSGGLLDIRQSRPMQNGQVHHSGVLFIHHTARSFAGRPKTREFLSRDVAEFDGKEWFLRYCVARVNVFLQEKPDWFNGSSGNAGLQYMTRGILDHLAAAEQKSDFALTDTLLQLDDTAIAHLYQNPAWTREREREPLDNLLSLAVAAELEGFVSEYIFGQQRSQQVLDSALWVAAALPRNFKVRDNSPARRQRILRLLLGSGANLHAEQNGITPFQALWIYREWNTGDRYLSEEHHEPGVVTQFLEHGQDPNIQIRYYQQSPKGALEDRRTYPLHLECQRGDYGAVKALISHGADINAPDSQQRTPLDEGFARLAGLVSNYLERVEAEKAADDYKVSSGLKSFESGLQLQAQSDCVSLLMSAGARFSIKATVTPTENGQFGKQDEITEAHLDLLRKEGIEVDRRVLDLSQYQGLSVRKSSFLHSTTKVTPRRLLRHRQG